MLQEHREQKLRLGPYLQGASDRVQKTLIYTEGPHNDAEESSPTAKWKEQTFSALESLQTRGKSQ